jgi:SM-20-related protein
MLDYSAISETTVHDDPYPHLLVPHALSTKDLAEAIKDFPKLDMGGLFLPEAVEYGPKFAQLLEELQGTELRRILGQKYGVDLMDTPLLTTIRGCSREKDGRIHVDAKFKVVTVLLYLNNEWSGDSGRLRVLRSPDNIEDYAEEVPAEGGALFSFRVTPNCWHGHTKFVGVRRAIMLNYCTDERLWERETKRHRMSGRIKKFERLFGLGRVPGVAL